eukprot:6238012-Prymnesium_polylepis.1
MSRPPVREIRAVYDDDTVRVYQAYSDEIADLAVAANSFEAPRKAGCWSAVRMTWIKPSAVWMAYRCGWTTMKDSRQARVLALDLSRARFEELLMSATLSHSDTAVGDCKKSPVVVQWDPEREMDATADKKQVVTRGTPDVRSIQIGLRGESVQTLLDASFVRRITDVTGNFRQAAALLGAGDVDGAAKALWPTAERPMQVPAALRAVLAMDATPDVPLASVAVPAAAPAPVEAGGPPAPAADADRLPLGAPEPKRLRSWGERSLAAALPGGSEGACKASSASADMPATPPPPPSASAGGATEAAAAVVSRGGGKAKGGGKAVNPRTESRWVEVGRGRLTASGAP